MKEQRITIEIGSDGKIAADAEGFSGDACLGELERLLEGLAPSISSLEKKKDTSPARVTSSRTQGVGRKP